MTRVAVAECKITISGKEVPDGAMQSVVTDADVDQPDMCVISFNNAGFAFSTDIKLGDAVDVKIGQKGETGEYIFRGEVVGLEPVFEATGQSRAVLRCFNRLHRLTRGRKSRTYEKMTDGDIVKKIAGDYKLTPKCDTKVNIKHDHVYQHNQTDLEFILQLAARIDYEVLVDNSELTFRPRDVSKDTGITIEWANQESDYVIEIFAPRLSSAGLVQEVNVRGWDPVKKEAVIGKATAPAHELGDADGAAAAQEPFSKKFYYDVDIPIGTVAEANAIAKAKLEELSLNYITGEAVCFGDPTIKVGTVVSLKCKDDRFDGKYYLLGVSHRFTRQEAEKGGYRTVLRVRRNAAAK
jgi:uncharacterized protein